MAFISLKGLDFPESASDSFTSVDEGNPLGKFGFLLSRNELLRELLGLIGAFSTLKKKFVIFPSHRL